MKKKLIVIITSMFLIATAMPIFNMAAETTDMNTQQAVDLRSTSTYAVLAGESITNTGTTVINGTAGGDIGLYAGTSVTGWETVTMNGTLHVSDAEAILAKTELIYAYDDAAGRTPAIQIPTQLGGTTLTPGTYVSQSGNFDLTGTLILDAQNNPNAVFVFLTSTTLITASSSDVSLIGGTQAGLVYWQVGSSATLGSNSDFSGHILALTSITADTGAIIKGQLLARNGSVWLHGNTITNDTYEIIADTSSDVSDVNSDVSDLSSDATDLSSDVSDVNSDVSDLSSDVSDVNSDVSEASSDVSEASSDVSETSSDVSEASSDVSETSSDVSDNNVNPVTGDGLNWLISLLVLVTVSGTVSFILHKKTAKFKD